VPQDDIIHRELTVYEALYYTARLRLPADPKHVIETRINEVLKQVGLYEPEKNIDDVRRVIIGSAEKKGISGGQRKRVNLAMELLSDPDLLFLDEPTSGLSSQDALTIMTMLRKLADNGKTIIIVIHQPSLEVYKKMDNVIIISKGKLAFFGPSYPDSITFFNPDKAPESITHNADNALIGLEEGEQKGVDWPERYNNSEYFKTYITGRKEETVAAPAVKAARKPSPGFGFSQWLTLTKRYFTVKRKDVFNTAILLLQAPIIALLIALVFHDKEGPALVPLFLLVISALWFGVSNASREIVAEKAIYERERMVNLKIPPYIFSKYAVLSFLCTLQCLIMEAILYPILDLEGNVFMIFFVSFISSLAGLSLGLFVSSITKTQQQAIAITPLILIPMVVLGGSAMQTIKDMNKPTYALSFLAPSRWAYEHILHIEFDKKSDKDSQSDNTEESDDASQNDDSPQPQTNEENLGNVNHFNALNDTQQPPAANLPAVAPSNKNPCVMDETMVIKQLYDDRKRESYQIVLVMLAFVVGFLLATMWMLKLRDKV
jgi:ABC-type multidrug transport system ATPase subunit